MTPNIKLAILQVTPFVSRKQDQRETWKPDAEWLRQAVNMLYNRKKAAFHLSGIVADVFHNHNEKTSQTIVRYPLVQYHARADGLFVVGINEGGDALEQLATLYDQMARLSDEVCVTVHLTEKKEHAVSVTPYPYRYHMANYLPFSAEAYASYRDLTYLKQKTDSIAQRIENHIEKDFAKHLQLPIENVKIEIVDIASFQQPLLSIQVNKRRHDFKPFDVIFDAAVDLPDGVCLGNGKTYGFGLLERLE